MRHFGSLVLALVLAPVIWGAVAFGPDRLARSLPAPLDLAQGDRYLGIGLLLVAALALGVLLVPRLSPVGPAVAGAGSLAVAAWGLVSGSPVWHIGDGILNSDAQRTLVTPIASGYLWLVGFLLLIPLGVPARWRKPRRATAPQASPGGAAPAPYGPPGGPGGSGATPGAPGGGARYGDPSGVADPAEGTSPTLIGPPPANFHPGAYGSNADDGGYRAEPPTTPGWDSPPQQRPAPASPYYGERPAQSPGSAQFPSASPYPGSAGGAGTQYPASTYGAPASAESPAYPAQPYPTTYSSPDQPPGPTSYTPTVYGRSRSSDDADPPRPPLDDDPQETRRLP